MHRRLGRVEREPIADVGSIAHVGQDHRAHQRVGGALRLLDRFAAAGDHQRVSRRAAGQEPSALQHQLAEVKLLLFLGRQRAPERQRLTSRGDGRLRVRKRRHRQHHADGESSVRAEAARPIAVQHRHQDRVPGIDVQRVEDGESRVSEPAGQLERPDPAFVHDGVQVDVPLVPALPQDRREAPQRRLQERPRAAVGDQRPHLARQLSQIAREEPLVLPVEAGRLEKRFAVEVGTHAHLDSRHVLHQDEGGPVEGPFLSLQLEDVDHVRPVGQLAHVVASGREAAVELEDVPGRVPPDEPDRIVESVEGVDPGGAQARVAQRRLAERAIVLQTLAQRAAADDLEAFPPQLVLLGAQRGLLEHHQSVPADPAELAAPVGRARDDPRKDALAGLVGDEDPDFVAASGKPPVEVAEVVRLADPEHAHAPTHTANRVPLAKRAS